MTTLPDRTARIRTGRDRETRQDVYARIPWRLGASCEGCDEFPRHQDGEVWIEETDPDLVSRWVEFRGERVTASFGFEQWNGQHIHSWKGYDEVRAHGSWWVAINGVRSWQGSNRDPIRALTAIQQAIEYLTSPDCPIEWDREGWAGLIDRKVYYREQPGTITGVVQDQGCVIIEAMDPDGFSQPVWNKDGGGAADDENDFVKVELDSPHIWWWRD